MQKLPSGKKICQKSNSKHSSCEFPFSPQADLFIRTDRPVKVKLFFKYFRRFRDNTRSGLRQNTTEKSRKRATKATVGEKNSRRKNFCPAKSHTSRYRFELTWGQEALSVISV